VRPDIFRNAFRDFPLFLQKNYGLRDSGNSPSFRAEVRNAWSFTSMLVSWNGAVTEEQCYFDEYVTMGLSFTASNSL
jgi:hypothetical protein